MALRFRKSIKLLPGVRINLGSRGGSVTLGPRGSTVNFGKNGVYSNVGIPGTGLHYRSKIAGAQKSTRTHYKNNSSSLQQNTYQQVKVSVELEDDGTVLFKDENGNLFDDYLVTQIKKQNKELILQCLEEKSAEKNQKTEDLISFHLTTPPPDTEITFSPAMFEELPPIEPSSIFSEVMPVPPIPKKHGFFAKHINFCRTIVDKNNLRQQIKFQDKMIVWEQNKRNFENTYQKKKAEYDKLLCDYINRKNNFDDVQDARKKFIEVDRFTDMNSMQDFLEETLQLIDWPRETNISFEVATTKKSIIVDIDLPEFEDMPKQQTVVSKKEMRINFKEISETQKRINYYKHIHAIGFRVIGEIFVALPTIDLVTISAYSQRVDKKTGSIIDEYLYSANVSRDVWNTINFNNLSEIDMAEAFDLFDLRRKASKTGVISPIEPF